jgi:hypothetical protein
MPNANARALGRLGGLAGGRAGGRARAQSLTAERRKEIARNAALSRWEGRVPDSIRGLMWSWPDLDNEINANEHVGSIMYQVLAFGNAQQKLWLENRYGRDRVKTWIESTPRNGLTVQQMAEWIGIRKAKELFAARGPESVNSLWANR